MPNHPDIRAKAAAVTQSFVDTSYFIQAGYHHALLDDMAPHTALWSNPLFLRTMLIILKPDAIYSGKYTAIIDALSDVATPLWSTVHFDPVEHEFEELYKYNLTLRNSQNQIGSWWINRALYTMGPSLICLMGVPDDDTRIEAFYAAVKRLKGPSNPFLGEGLRQSLAATNTAMNLIHTADDPLSSLRELRIFVPDGTLMGLFERAASNKPGMSWARIKDQLDVFFADRVHSLDFASSLRFLWNCLYRIAHPEAPSSVFLRKVEPSANAWRAIEKTLSDARHTLALLGTTADLSADSHLALALLHALSHPETLDSRAIADTLNKARTLCPALTRWDALVLRSTLHYWNEIPQPRCIGE